MSDVVIALSVRFDNLAIATLPLVARNDIVEIILSCFSPFVCTTLL